MYESVDAEDDAEESIEELDPPTEIIMYVIVSSVISKYIVRFCDFVYQKVSSPGFFSNFKILKWRGNGNEAVEQVELVEVTVHQE